MRNSNIQRMLCLSLDVAPLLMFDAAASSIQHLCERDSCVARRQADGWRASANHLQNIVDAFDFLDVPRPLDSHGSPHAI